VRGPTAQAFLDAVTTNEVASLKPGQSLYSYLLFSDGSVVDDLLIYRLGDERYMMVVNASNNDKNWAWLNAVNDGQARIDDRRPWVRAPHTQLRDLRAPETGDERRVDIALQGPNSLKLLQALAEGDAAMQKRLAGVKRTDLILGEIGGFDLIVSRTGYTGESFGYELFIHPDRAPELWKRLIEVGQPFGIKPIGLAARDSLRTEAGLPLYGHELEGPLGLKPGDAGFASYVKLWKPFFIGRRAYVQHEQARTAEVVRFRMNEKGVRKPNLGDPVVNNRGQVIGHVTSCSLDTEGYLLGQAYLNQQYTEPGAAIGVFATPTKAEKAKGELKVGDRVQLHDAATVLTRFPKRS
jgi:glycine hydroxymethyltransferase